MKQTKTSDPFDYFNIGLFEVKHTKEEWFNVSFRQDISKPFISLYRKKLFEPAIKFRELDNKKRIINQTVFITWMLSKYNIFDKLSDFKYNKIFPRHLFAEFLPFKNYTIKYKKKSTELTIEPNPLSIVLLKIRKEIKGWGDSLFIKSWVLEKKGKTYGYIVTLTDSPKESELKFK